MKEIILDFNKINSLEEFYDETQLKLAGTLGDSYGRNLDAFNDLLRGGFQPI